MNLVVAVKCSASLHFGVVSWEGTCHYYCFSVDSVPYYSADELAAVKEKAPASNSGEVVQIEKRH